jgi:hypothetical protein
MGNDSSRSVVFGRIGESGVALYLLERRRGHREMKKTKQNNKRKEEISTWHEQGVRRYVRVVLLWLRFQSVWRRYPRQHSKAKATS